LARNPFVSVRTALHDAAPSGDTLPVYRISPSEPWRALRASRWAAAGESMPRSELGAEGYFTSACGITIYRGAAYPKQYRGNAFLAEVAGNLIHREVLTPDGVTRIVLTRAPEELVISNVGKPSRFRNAILADVADHKAIDEVRVLQV